MVRQQLMVDEASAQNEGHHIGRRLRAIREAKGYSLEQVGDRLGVVHTTVRSHEQAADHKTGLIQRFAEILEVSPRYLRGEDPDLEGIGEALVARRESLRLFLERDVISAVYGRRYQRIREMGLAPTTVEGWRLLHGLIQQFLGRTPDEPLAARGPAVERVLAPSKKRMARVEGTSSSKNRVFRLVG